MSKQPEVKAPWTPPSAVQVSTKTWCWFGTKPGRIDRMPYSAWPQNLSVAGISFPMWTNYPDRPSGDPVAGELSRRVGTIPGEGGRCLPGVVAELSADQIEEIREGVYFQGLRIVNGTLSEVSYREWIERGALEKILAAKEKDASVPPTGETGFERRLIARLWPMTVPVLQEALGRIASQLNAKRPGDISSAGACYLLPVPAEVIESLKGVTAEITLWRPNGKTFLDLEPRDYPQSLVPFTAEDVANLKAYCTAKAKGDLRDHDAEEEVATIAARMGVEIKHGRSAP